MNEGWLCDSTLKATHQPSPTSITPAFSPGGTTTRSPVVGKRLRCTREDLYEQCSDHITEKTPSSTNVGSRPKSLTMRAYSSCVRLCAATTSVVIVWESIRENGATLLNCSDCEGLHRIKARAVFFKPRARTCVRIWERVGRYCCIGVSGFALRA